MAAALALPLAGCGGLPVALSALGGALSIAKNGFELDVSVRQLVAVRKDPAALTCPPAAPLPVPPNLSLDGN